MTDHSDPIGVLRSAREAISLCRFVQINEARLAEVCANIDPHVLTLPTWEFPVFYRQDPDRLAGQILLFNSINFCYWGDPRWEVEYAGQWWSGSMAVLSTIHRALDEGAPVLDGFYLAQLSEADFRHILRGRGELLLVPERHRIWREVGATLVSRFDGSFTKVIRAANGDAVALVHALLEAFPSFDDTSDLDGHPVRFYKRVQLAVGMLYEAFAGKGWGALSGIDRLTVFADYKVPQVLRRLGILEYAHDLAEQIDGEQTIPHGDRCEVEIRVATIWAAELMRQALVSRVPGVSALHIDYWLWFAGRYQGPEVKPFHRTLTTAY